MVAMTHRDVTTGGEGHYNIIDWRSWKLARVARSTLAAESQAASDASDALLFASTFWKLIWEPWLPLDDIKTAQCSNSPKLVIDAKALYDMMTKTEVQAGSNTDKRTAIEVLVSQDKLLCCNASTLWVSSELQYADGLTKAAAAQLLADRMRSHLTRLKSDEDFVASKKKTHAERKRGTERYAIKRPSTSTATAMFAAFCTTAATAMDYENDETFIHPNETNLTYILDNLNSDLEPYSLTFVIGIFMMMGALTTCRCLTAWPWRAMTSLRWIWKVMTLKEGDAPETLETAVQTDDDPLIDDLNDLLGQKIRLEALLEQTEEQLRAANEGFEALQTIHQDTTYSRRRAIIEAGQQEIYLTAEGRVWHASYECLRNRTQGPIISRLWCTNCLDQLGMHPGNQAPAGATTSRMR